MTNPSILAIVVKVIGCGLLHVKLAKIANVRIL